MTGLRIEGVEKAFGEHLVLRGVDLEIPTGSFCSILGRSGSGKTTLLRTIAGFERPNAGSISLDETTLDDGSQFVPPERRRIGYVPQDGNLFPHLNVAANVGFGLDRAERRGARIEQLLEMVGLSGFDRRFPHELSGGQQQRVALARALAINPTLVLLDEPFSSLDAGLRQTVRNDVRQVLAKAGATVLLVTHDQDEALSISDQVAIIEHGRIGQVDAPGHLYAHPRSATLARGLGGANFLRGVVHDGVVKTVLGELALAPPSHADGTDLLVLIRPEQVELIDASNETVPAGRVVEREYYGHDAVVRVRSAWDPDFMITVRLANTSILPGVGELVGLDVRGEVVGWPEMDDPSRHHSHHSGDPVEHGKRPRGERRERGGGRPHRSGRDRPHRD